MSQSRTTASQNANRIEVADNMRHSSTLRGAQFSARPLAYLIIWRRDEQNFPDGA
jgi:hypothetical protein